jgi:hypothetical protein
LYSATRSAHIVRPYEAFSMLQPVMMRPSVKSKAAPTWKFEYGATRALAGATSFGDHAQSSVRGAQ